MTENNNSGAGRIEDCVSENVKAILYTERQIEEEKRREEEDIAEMSYEEEYEYMLIDVGMTGSGAMERGLGAAIRDLTDEEREELWGFQQGGK